MVFKFSKNSRPAMTSYKIFSILESSISRIILAIVFAVLCLLIALIPGLEKIDRTIAAVFFIGGPIAMVIAYKLSSPITNKMRNEKLEQLYDCYVLSLSKEEQDSIKAFLLMNDIFAEFQSHENLGIIDSLIKKQILYKEDYFGEVKIRMERWAFDYFISKNFK